MVRQRPRLAEASERLRWSSRVGGVYRAMRSVLACSLARGARAAPSEILRRAARVGCSLLRWGDDESKTGLDAFFLGKAFAEALRERIESVVGEGFGVVGQWQAE
ncbi:hypothetical protein GUJ93_ZPchr0006g44123 [Zizania palustris]|uniref:Uncharacterized protein n=1 Tax=Zizania palustris TaxID=103762 RepID=A0A8J5W273_ZIZPA|nr:hypothetical protein GUJ93_ZPchr0006g44123 [Zizania palustris]